MEDIKEHHSENNSDSSSESFDARDERTHKGIHIDDERMHPIQEESKNEESHRGLITDNGLPVLGRTK